MILIGNWCLALDQMVTSDTYVYQHCPGSDSNIIVRRDGFDAEGTSCQLINIKQEKRIFYANFKCTGNGLKWSEDDEIKIKKNGWTLKAKIYDAKRISDPIYYCLQGPC